jgi:hypothetical protein
VVERSYRRGFDLGTVCRPVGVKYAVSAV